MGKALASVQWISQEFFYERDIQWKFAMVLDIGMHCDSKSVLTQIKWLAAATITFPNTTVEDDYDVYSAISQVIHQMKPWTFNFQHVKGHQDSNPRRWQPPTLPECLDIDCNCQAGKLLPHAWWLTQPAHPQLPYSYPHIVIHVQTIVCDLSGSLRHAAMTPDYHTYLQNKYQLNNTAINDINWMTIKLAIWRLTVADRTRIQKFLHDWLPLKGASHTAND